MKILGYIFAVLAVIEFISIFFKHPQNWLMALIAGLMAYAILSDSEQHHPKPNV